MASVSPGGAGANMDSQGQGHQSLFTAGGVLPGPGRPGGGGGGSGYYVNTSDGASTCSSSTTEPGEADSLGGSGGTLLVLEPKSLRSFETNDEYLYAMQEDLADWFSCLYQTDVTADNFFNVLETGVLLCRHANKVQENARQMRERGETLEMRSYFIRSVPERNVQFRENVKPETFQARDNISNFISWGRQLGIPEVLSFETDDLVLRKNEKSVILCLLELARVGAKLGMLAPTLVQMEEEIDAELAGEEPKPQVQVKTCDMRSLDERVRDLIGRCTCPIQFPMIKVGDGKYKIGDSRSLIFVRILRNHVMVRVGGGWDTLENYLNKHDPCQCNYRGHRAGTAQAAHKMQVNQSQQQRRASTPGGNSAHHLPSGGGGAGASVTNTPTSPRRMSSVAPPLRHRSVSPQNHPANQGTTGSGNTSVAPASPAKQNPPRSKSPTLIISRHTPSAGGGGAANKARGGASVSNSFSSNTSGNSNFSVSRVSTNQSGRGEGVVSKSWSQPLNRPASNSTNSSTNNSNASNNGNADSASALSSQPMRTKSPSPGRLRSPSPLSVAKTSTQLPSSTSRTAAGASTVRAKGQGHRVVTPRRLPGSNMLSDNEQDESEDYHADNDDYYHQYEGADDDSDENESKERAVDNVDALYAGPTAADNMSDSGSVSFDERAEWDCDQRSSSSSLEKVYDHTNISDRPEARREEGGGNGRRGKDEENVEDKSSVSMDKISTMTLTEFRSLLNSNLSVPENQLADSQNDRGGGNIARSPAGSSDPGQHQASWDSLREKARSVRDSISNTVSNRRTTAGATAVGRRSLPQSPDGSSPASSFERPKTPQALRRNRNSSTGRTSPVSRPKTPTSVSRPKTPTSGISRPKTPTSGIARPKTPTSAPKEEYRMSRPKTPSQVKRDAVAKVAGAISNWVDSRPDVASNDRSSSSVSRPKTPTSRPKTPTKQQATRRWDGGEDGDADVDDDFDDDEDNAEVSDLQMTRAVPAEPRDRPSTPSRIPKPSFLPRPTTPKISSIPVSTDPTVPPSRERPHTSLGTSSSITLSSQEEEILQRQQQLQRLQMELEEAQKRMDEDRRKRQQQQKQQHQQSHATRPNFLPTNSLSRSNSNASSEAVQSPSSTVNGSGPKTKIAVSRKLPLPRGSSEDSGGTSRSYRDVYTARRCVTPGPGNGEMRPQPSRAVTPGPREKWTIGASGGSSKTSQQRRGSLNSGAATERVSSTWQRQSNHNGSARNSNGATGNNVNNRIVNGDLPFTNEITFSDDEEINELVRNAALMNGAQSVAATPQTSDSGRVRSASVDARRLERQATRRNSKGGEEVLMVRRDSSGGHAVEVPGKDKPPPKGIVRRPQKTQGSGIVKPTTSTVASSPAARFRSQTPDPSMFRQRLTTSGQKPGVARPTTPSADSHSRGGKPLNRTEAWVDTTLSDPKRKLPTKPRRARGGVEGAIPASELAPRPLEEIQAILSTPRDGASTAAVVGPAGLDAPPEDPEMFRKMEKLFEKYREMELRASVNETPGGPPVNGATPSKSSSEIQSSSGRPGSLKSSGGAVSSGKQSLSIRTSSTGSGGAPASTSQRVSPMRQSSVTSNSVDLSRYQRASSAPQQQRGSVSAINSPSTDLREFSGAVDSSTRDSNRYRAVSHGEADQKGLQGSLRDIDPETAKNPAALITKIKEILKVRPRRDENAQIAKTRIPAPSSLTRASRSKSVSNLFSGGGESSSLSVSTRGVLKHTTPSNGGRTQQGKLNRANSGSSGNISYSEFVFNDEEESVDNVPELSKAWSVKSDSSDSQTRSETPVPKLATPLTTGRSTLISRKGDRMGRSLSQDKENNLSNSQTSLSGRSTFSATEEDADYV